MYITWIFSSNIHITWLYRLIVAHTHTHIYIYVYKYIQQTHISSLAMYVWLVCLVSALFSAMTHGQETNNQGTFYYWWNILETYNSTGFDATNWRSSMQSATRMKQHGHQLRLDGSSKNDDVQSYSSWNWDIQDRFSSYLFIFTIYDWIILKFALNIEVALK